MGMCMRKGCVSADELLQSRSRSSYIYIYIYIGIFIIYLYNTYDV